MLVVLLVPWEDLEVIRSNQEMGKFIFVLVRKPIEGILAMASKNVNAVLSTHY